MEAPEAVLAWTDLAAAARHKAVRSRVWVLLVPVGAFFVLLTALVPLLPLRAMGLFLVAFVLGIPLWAPTAATWIQARRRTWPQQPTRWRATSDGVVVESAGGRQTLPMATLTRVDPWRRGVSLSYGRAVAFIPRRAFQDDGHRRSFVEAVRYSMAATSE